jgi:hypothetical protein
MPLASCHLHHRSEPSPFRYPSISTNFPQTLHYNHVHCAIDSLPSPRQHSRYHCLSSRQAKRRIWRGSGWGCRCQRWWRRLWLAFLVAVEDCPYRHRGDLCGSPCGIYRLQNLHQHITKTSGQAGRTVPRTNGRTNPTQKLPNRQYRCFKHKVS